MSPNDVSSEHFSPFPADLRVLRGPHSKCKPKTVPSGFCAVAASAERPCANQSLREHGEEAPVIAAMRCDELLDAFDYEDARTYQAIKRGQTGPAAPRRT